MPELIGSNLLKKQNERIALGIVNELSTFIDSKKIDKEFIEEQVNRTLFKIFNKDEEFAELILQLLEKKYSLDYKFNIKKN